MQSDRIGCSVLLHYQGTPYINRAVLSLLYKSADARIASTASRRGRQATSTPIMDSGCFFMSAVNQYGPIARVDSNQQLGCFMPVRRSAWYLQPGSGDIGVKIVILKSDTYLNFKRGWGGVSQSTVYPSVQID